MFNPGGKVLPKILAKTDRWLVFEKPPGWLSIPGRASAERGALPVLSEWAEQEFGRLWTVHRLDRDTSGVILMARTAEDRRQANQWFEERQVRKIYHLIAQGVPTVPVFRLSQPIEGVRAVTQ